MIGLLVLIAAVWQSPTGRVVLLIIAALLALDLAMGMVFGPGDIFDLPRRLMQRRQMRQQRQVPRQRELNNAARGAGLLALLGLGLVLAGWPLIDEFLSAAWAGELAHGAAVLAVAAVAVVGLILFSTGAHKALQSAGERETRLIAWALLRLMLGAALWWLFDHPPADAAPWVALARSLLPACAIIVAAVALWLAVTGTTKLLLILWGGNRAAAIIGRIVERRNAPLRPARW